MTKEPKQERVPLMMEASLLQQIDTFRFTRRIGSRAEAIRQLIKDGLKMKISAQAGE